jgi:hypothetical protein
MANSTLKNSGQMPAENKGDLYRAYSTFSRRLLLLTSNTVG